MKNILIFFIFSTLSFASYDNYELKLYEKILPMILTENLLIYADNNSKSIIEDSSILKTTLDCKKATLLIGKKFNNLDGKCKNKPIFSTSHRSFKKTTNSIGAFYWRKGRPQIKFNTSTMEKFNLMLPRSLKEFAQ